MCSLDSNPKVQVQAMETGSLPQLIRLLSTDENMTVRKRVLFSISSLIRQFPYAQQKFLQLGGLAALAQLFSEKGTEKLQLKAITLLHDLLLEQVDNVFLSCLFFIIIITCIILPYRVIY